MASFLWPLVAGDTFAVVTGSFPAAYVVTPSAFSTVGDWSPPSLSVSMQTSGSFRVDFGSPATAGSALGVLVTAVGQAPLPNTLTSTLLDYLTRLRRLLHDPQDVYWPSAPLPQDKVDAINEAMHQRDLDTAANRITQPFTLTAGLSTYDYSALPNPSTFDVVSIACFTTGAPTGLRYVLDQMSKVDLTATWRMWEGYTDWPVAFAKDGQSTILIGPAPALAYATEWDTCVIGPPLVNATDVDTLRYPYTIPIPYYAAYILKDNERQPAEADRFLAAYQTRIDNLLASRVGMMASVYPVRG